MWRRRMRVHLTTTLAAFCLCLWWTGAAQAAALEVQVQDQRGKNVQDAVVYAVELGPDGKPLPPPEMTEIDQVNKEYVPFVTAVRVGTQINFPNHDPVRHHVYSFSPAKTFEIPLYKGMPPEPILFDKPGAVSLGCNIHDWMLAYVFVAPTPHFSVTGADGRANLSDLTAGRYEVQVWHPKLGGAPGSTTQQVSVGEGAGTPLRFAIELKYVWRPRRAPSARGGQSYR
jgi:hypothetical protein